MKPRQPIKINSSIWQIILLGTVLFLSCGNPPNIEEALNYMDKTSNTVALLSSYESDLRTIADGLSEEKPPQNWLQSLERIKGELDGIFKQEYENSGEYDQQNMMRLQMLNWINAVLLAAEEGLRENPNLTQKALNIYHYLDIADEFGRITRSERELMIGNYRGLH